MKYKRILLKISGEALAGDLRRGLDFEIVNSVCKVIKQCVDEGVQLGLVIGGGNFWRGVKDGGDHSMAFPLDQNVLFAKMSEGEEPTLVANKGCELKPDEEKIEFYYRDNDALVAGTLPEMNATVSVNGVSYDMEYNASEIFEIPLRKEEPVVCGSPENSWRICLQSLVWRKEQNICQISCQVDNSRECLLREL